MQGRREIARFAAATRSPILTTFIDSIHGTTNIRLAGQQEYFQRRFMDKIDEYFKNDFV